jgi:hypothetical protein
LGGITAKVSQHDIDAFLLAAAEVIFRIGYGTKDQIGRLDGEEEWNALTCANAQIREPSKLPSEYYVNDVRFAGNGSRRGFGLAGQWLWYS